MSFNWECPHCHRPTTIVDSSKVDGITTLTINNADGNKQLLTQFIVCPNPSCRKYALSVSLHDYEYVGNVLNAGWKATKLVNSWRLVPQSGAKVFPDYIPEGILNDYKEACAIKDLSPKASATLSRRCLQGMIRDFFGISKRTLLEEIKAIKEKIAPTTWEGIDAIRAVGNIGAHMERDIDIIIDVEPNEAQLLIDLVEQLLGEWYIDKHNREERLASITAMAKGKNDLKTSLKKDIIKSAESHIFRDTEPQPRGVSTQQGY